MSDETAPPTNGPPEPEPTPPPEPTVQAIPPTALEAITRAEIDTQVSTAKRFPRSLNAFKTRALAMACVDQETAQSCTYMVPRSGKIIEGPSIRLAEICLATWGNLRAGSRVIGEDDKCVTAQAFAHDLENNVAITTEVRRGILNRHGGRYTEDMILTTGAAACAIGLRNAVFSVVPRVFVDQIRAQAARAAAGDERTLGERREKAVGHFVALGVTLERILQRLTEASEKPHEGIEDIDLKDLALLHGFATSIRDGVASVTDLFPSAAETTSRAGALAKEIAGKRKATKDDKKSDG